MLHTSSPDRSRPDRTSPLLPCWLMLVTIVWGLVGVSVAEAQVTQEQAAPPAPRPCLKQISADAQAAVILPKLSETNGQIAALQRQLQLPVPEMDNLLEAFKNEAGMINGFNDDGALAIVFRDLDKAIADHQPPTAFLLIPVTDYAAFVGNFAGNAGQPVTAITLRRHAGFARKLGGYALLGKSKEAVAAYQPAGDVATLANKLGSFGQRYLSEADAALYLDVDALRPTLTHLLDQAPQMLQQELQQNRAAHGGAGGAGGAAAAMPMGDVKNVQAMVQVEVQAAKAVVNSATALRDCARPQRQGHRPDQDDQLQGRLRPGAGPARRRKPHARGTGPPAGAVAPVRVRDGRRRLGDRQAGDAVFAGHAQGGGQSDARAHRPFAADARPGAERASVWFTPTQQSLMSGEFMNAVNVYRVADAEQFRQQLQSYFKGIDGLEIKAPAAAEGGAGAGDAQPTRITASYTPNALNISGAKVDQYSYQVQWPPAMQQQLQQMGPMGAISLSMQRQMGYVVAKGNHVAMTTRRDPQLVRQVLATIDQRTGIGSSNAMQDLREIALPPQPALETYISVHGLAELANLYLPMYLGKSLQIPADLPPIALGVSIDADGHNAVGRVFVPRQTLRFLAGIRQQLAGPGTRNDGRRPPQPHDSPAGPPPWME